MYNIIIDCDPGHDDIVAILCAYYYKEYFNILGITTVAGNNTVDNVTNNVNRVFTHFNIDIDIAKGCSTSLQGLCQPQMAHGKYGMDGPDYLVQTRPILEINAIQAMKNWLDSSNNKVTLIALGPLTNIATFIKAYPDYRNKIEQIVLMGGSIYSGNILLRSEFNFYADSIAADIVFNSNIKIVMAPIEVCQSVGIDLNLLQEFKGSGKLYKFLDELFNFYTKYSYEHNLSYTTIFDLVPVIYLLKPQIFSYIENRVYIETSGKYCKGCSVVDFNQPNSNHKILIKGDKKEFSNIFFNTMNMLNKQL